MTGPSPKSFLDLINIIDNVPHDFHFDTLYRLLLPNDDRPHGLIDPAIAQRMPWSSQFKIDTTARTIQLFAPLSQSTDVAKLCSDAFQETIDTAIAAKTFSLLNVHSEMYKILGANQFVHLERFAAPLFGIAGSGAHMTAFVRTPTGVKIWVAKRAAHLVTYPSKLDTTVAGGVKATQSPLECIIAEANEEASLPTSFVSNNAVAVGTITHCLRSARSGLFSMAVLYLYDIELTEDMVPTPGDDEVEGFELKSVEQVIEKMLAMEFKPNSSLVMLDFFIRHGIYTQASDVGYEDIVGRLHRRLPVAISPN